jgi:hypothetical protein
MRGTRAVARATAAVVALLVIVGCTGARPPTSAPVAGDLLWYEFGGGLCPPVYCYTAVDIKADGAWTVTRRARPPAPDLVSRGTLDPAVLAELTRRIKAEIGTLYFLPTCAAECWRVPDQGTTRFTFTGPDYAIAFTDRTHVIGYNTLVAYARTVVDPLIRQTQPPRPTTTTTAVPTGP